MMCDHRWQYKDGRSVCACGAWAADLRCLPALRQPRGRYPTATGLQQSFACPICLSNVRTRVVLGELRIVCDGPQAHDIVALGRAMPKEKRDLIIEHLRCNARCRHCMFECTPEN